MTWVRFGIDDVEKSLGITVAPMDAVAVQWAQQQEAVRTKLVAAKPAMAEMSTSARVVAIKGAYASLVPYQAKIQVPTSADAEIARTQKVMDAALFPKFAWMTAEEACQPHADGGLAHVHLQSRLEAEWAELVVAKMVRRQAWMAAWDDALRQAYGGAAEGIEESTCSFHLLQNSGASGVQKRAYAVYGGLMAPRGEVVPAGKEERQRGPRREMGGHRWSQQQVRAQRLFFNVWYVGASELAGRSSVDLERTAVDWARVGLTTVGQLFEDGHPIPRWRFAARYGHRRVSMYDALRAVWPAGWYDAMRMRTVDEVGCVQVVSPIHPTLTDRAPTLLSKLTVADLYSRLLAKRWKWLVKFGEHRDARRLWETAVRPARAMRADVARIYTDLRHPAVPRHMSDWVMKNAVSADYVGPRYRARIGRKGMLRVRSVLGASSGTPQSTNSAAAGKYRRRGGCCWACGRE